jgi:hypothetical protein
MASVMMAGEGELGLGGVTGVDGTLMVSMALPANSPNHSNLSPSANADATSDSPRPLASVSLASRLTGELPCVSCRYDLRGLSVRDVCPECGTAVRATILAAVDPYAQVLRPIRAPRLVAAGLLLWIGAALVAALLVWISRLMPFVSDAGVASPPWLVTIIPALIMLSAIGALALVAPHASIPAWQRVSAMVGASAIAAIVPVIAALQRHDLRHVSVFQDPEQITTQRAWLRLAIGALLIVALLALRPNARLLAARPLLMRLGMVDRQTMRVLALVIAAGMMGDGLHILTLTVPLTGTSRQAAILLGLALIVITSFLLTLGLVSMLRDTLRIVKVILRPAPGLDQILQARTSEAGAA